MPIDQIEEKLKKDVWWVLQEIKKEKLATPDDEYTCFEPYQGDALPSQEDQRRAIKILSKEGAIKIITEKFPLNMGYSSAAMFNWKPIKFYLDILQPNFNEIFERYENKFHYTNQGQKLLQPIIKSDEVNLGPLIYKDGFIYYKSDKLDLTPQAVKLCKLFMQRPDDFFSDETIKATISTGDFINQENMQKIVSKLRTTLRRVNKKLDIKRMGNKGYSFMSKEIR